MGYKDYASPDVVADLNVLFNPRDSQSRIDLINQDRERAAWEAAYAIERFIKLDKLHFPFQRYRRPQSILDQSATAVTRIELRPSQSRDI